MLCTACQRQEICIIPHLAHRDPKLKAAIGKTLKQCEMHLPRLAAAAR